ncbi:MAG: SPOR domain-containing protein [Uliginosibacterium sp.]|jgi:cell division protein FtsN|nr:SPOR domain-containing protein [Uliginosibacterium sp.]MBK9393347.1 SPOR domain-containing protein [Uliginosibacterium sp.]MBK9615355.1 SPOR domain-containing protein [Uliginosibacterium sp.]
MNVTSPAARYQRGNTVSGLLIGLLIGILIAAGIAAYINFGPKPFVLPKPDSSASKPLQSAPAAGGNTPIALPGKPGDRPVTTTQTPASSQSAAAEGEKSKFDFYKILPGGETASAPAPAKPTETPSDKVALQAGAYQDPSEADNLKARLAMMGVEAKVQRVDLGEKGVFYRVRLGPFDTPADADEMRAKLASEGIETSVVKSNPKAAVAATAKH